MRQHSLLFIALWLLLSQCRKKADPEPITLLPPATQSGANTFGCLVNGQAFIPQGYNGTPNFDITYDPTFQGGNLDVRAYVATNQLDRYIILGGDGISRPGTYVLSSALGKDAVFVDLRRPFPCSHYDSDQTDTSCQGTLTITRLDLTTGIVAGTFSFTLAKPGCDTIRVTEGRFDNKL